jgi:hypothetical protein
VLEHSLSSHLIHVRPTNLGLWTVQPDELDTPLSQHTNETEAELAALEQAAALEDATVIVHDCYMRVHVVDPRAAVSRRRP